MVPRENKKITTKEVGYGNSGALGQASDYDGTSKMCCDQREKEEQCWVLEHRVLEEMQGQTDDSKHHMLLLHQVLVGTEQTAALAIRYILGLDQDGRRQSYLVFNSRLSGCSSPFCLEVTYYHISREK